MITLDILEDIRSVLMPALIIIGANYVSHITPKIPLVFHIKI